MQAEDYHKPPRRTRKPNPSIPIRLYMRVKLVGADAEQWTSQPITRTCRVIEANQIKIHRTTYTVTTDQCWATLEWKHKGEMRQTYRMPLVDWKILQRLNTTNEAERGRA